MENRHFEQKKIFFFSIFKQKLLPAIFIGFLIGLIIASFMAIFMNYPPLDGFLLSNGTLLGGDFIAFYTAGKMSICDRDNLYDFYSQKEFRTQILGVAVEAIKGELPFVHPPLVAWMFSWLVSLSFEKAFYCWLIVTSIISAGSLLLLAHELRMLNRHNLAIYFIAIFSFVPYLIECLMGGQLASLGILIYSLLFILLRREKDFLAGLIVSLAYYKPPYFMLAVIALIFSRGKYLILGFLVGSLTLIALTIGYFGFHNFASYLGIISHYQYGKDLMEGVKLPLTHGMGLYSLIKTFVSSPLSEIFYIGLFFIILRRVITALRLSPNNEPDSFSLAYVFMIASSLAFSLQLAKYDLSILLVTFIILTAQFPTTNNYLKGIGIIIIGFYLEFIWRNIDIGGFQMHASFFLFIPFLLLINFSLGFGGKTCNR